MYNRKSQLIFAPNNKNNVMIKWFKTAYATIKQWVLKKGLVNVGWLVAFVVAYLLFKEKSLFYSFSFVALGIFIEKNRKSLATIFKELKGKVVK